MASFQPHRAKNFHAIDFLCFVFLQASPIENVPGKAERLGAVRAWISPPYYVGSPDSRQTFHQGIKTVANYSSVRHSSEWEALSVVWSIGPNPHFSLSLPLPISCVSWPAVEINRLHCVCWSLHPSPVGSLMRFLLLLGVEMADDWFSIPLKQTLEERDRRHLQHKEQLNREQRFLRRKLEQLAQFDLSSQMNKRRGNSLSECSTSTTVSSASSLTSSVSSETGIAAFYGD